MTKKKKKKKKKKKWKKWTWCKIQPTGLLIEYMYGIDLNNKGLYCVPTDAHVGNERQMALSYIPSASDESYDIGLCTSPDPFSS